MSVPLIPDEGVVLVSTTDASWGAYDIACPTCNAAPGMFCRFNGAERPSVQIAKYGFSNYVHQARAGVTPSPKPVAFLTVEVEC